MLQLLQFLFLASLAGSVAWLVYLARHQDAADAGIDRSIREEEARPFRRP